MGLKLHLVQSILCIFVKTHNYLHENFIIQRKRY